MANVLTYQQFLDFYEKYGKTPNQMSRPKNPLNSNQLKHNYNKYLKSQDKKEAASKRYKKHVPKKKKIDEDWVATRAAAYKRDETCQLLFRAPDSFDDDFLGPLDPCHVFGKGAYPHMKYDVDNVVILYRIFHSRLDEHRNPFSGEYSDPAATEIWWRIIIGDKRYDKLLKRSKER